MRAVSALAFPRFHLRRVDRRATGAGVIGRASCLFSCLVLFSSCEKKKEVTVTETRALTARDKAPKLFANSDERFRDAKPSPVKGETPEGWLALPPSQFRLLNYRFGASGTGEVWVSISSGSVKDNINRWLNQFAAAPLDDEGVAKLRVVPIAGITGAWVEASGDYAGGMGAETKPGHALAGIVASSAGRILTVKMVGPKAEVEAASTVLENFAKSLKMAD